MTTKYMFTKDGESSEAGSFERGDICPDRVSVVTKVKWLEQGLLLEYEGNRKRKVKKEVVKNG